MDILQVCFFFLVTLKNLTRQCTLRLDAVFRKSNKSHKHHQISPDLFLKCTFSNILFIFYKFPSNFEKPKRTVQFRSNVVIKIFMLPFKHRYFCMKIHVDVSNYNLHCFLEKNISIFCYTHLSLPLSEQFP